MACGADDSGAYMHHVREINVVREAVDPYPGDWLPFIPGNHQFLDFRSVPGDEQMACPTVRHRRDAGNPRLGSVVVTIEALYSVVAGMHLMAEGERLNRRAVSKIQRQTVHKRQADENGTRGKDQPSNKPRYFHAVYQKETGL